MDSPFAGVGQSSKVRAHQPRSGARSAIRDRTLRQRVSSRCPILSEHLLIAAQPGQGLVSISETQDVPFLTVAGC